MPGQKPWHWASWRTLRSIAGSTRKQFGSAPRISSSRDPWAISAEWQECSAHLPGSFLTAWPAAAGRPRCWPQRRALADSIGVAHVAHSLYFERVLNAVNGRLTEQALAAAWAEGLTLPPDQVLTAMLKDAETITRQSGQDTGSDDGLTTREIEVLRLLAAGYTDREIGDASSSAIARPMPMSRISSKNSRCIRAPRRPPRQSAEV